MNDDYTAPMDIIEAMTQYIEDNGIDPSDLDAQKKFLEENLAGLPATKEQLTAQAENSMVNVNGKEMPSDMRDDFNTSRNNMLEMINSGMNGIQGLSKLASESNHPRVYEILSTFLKTMSDINKQLIEINVQKHKVMMDLLPSKEKSEGEGKQIANNMIFVGSTKTLQEFLKNNKK